MGTWSLRMELTRETLSNFYYIIRLSWSHYDIKLKR